VISFFFSRRARRYFSRSERGVRLSLRTRRELSLLINFNLRALIFFLFFFLEKFLFLASCCGLLVACYGLGWFSVLFSFQAGDVGGKMLLDDSVEADF
jgi:hypothetical protein